MNLDGGPARASEIGREAICPVMGSRFKVEKRTEEADYRGKAYFFCGGGCPALFSKNHEKYAEKEE